MSKLYLLIIEGGVEPEVRGPYKTDKAILKEARKVRENSDEDGVFRAEVDAKGNLHVFPFISNEVKPKSSLETNQSGNLTQTNYILERNLYAHIKRLPYC